MGTRVTSRPALSRKPRGLRAALPWVLWGVAVVAVAGGLVALDRAYVARERGDVSAPGDPATRVAGAIRSISGSDSVRQTTYDAAARKAKVEVASRYYDAKKSVKENREYLATEGRLGAQLALFGNTPVEEIAILLYARDTLLATVTARQQQKFEEMKVDYSGPLAQR
jgi:hypothetical protein